MGYSIKVLKNEEYDRLPFEFTKQSFAVTSPDKKNIFVRHTNLHDFNKMLVSHELDHLVEEVPTDEGPQGERYFLSGLLSGLGKIGSSIFGGLLGGGAGAGGGLMSNLIGGIGKQAINSMMPNNPLAQFAGSLIPGGGGSGGSGGGFTKNFLSPQQLQYQNSMNGIGGGSRGGSMFGNLFGGLTKGLGGIMGLFGKPQTQLGTGLLGVGLAKQFPKVPALPESVNPIRQRANAGGGPLAQLASSNVSGILNQQFNPLTEPELTAATANLDKSRMQDIKRLEDMYASVRPGTDYTTDTTYKQDLGEIEGNYAQAKANTVADRTRSAQELFRNNQSRAVQQAMGIDNEQMAQLMDIAQLDISQIMAQLNIDYAAALNFKQVFQELGGNLLLSGMDSQPNPFAGFNVGG